MQLSGVCLSVRLSVPFARRAHRLLTVHFILFVMEFIKQYNWFALSSTAHIWLFLMRATGVYFYLIFYV